MIIDQKLLLLLLHDRYIGKSKVKIKAYRIPTTRKLLILVTLTIAMIQGQFFCKNPVLLCERFYEIV